MHRLNYNGQEYFSKIAIYDSDIPVTLPYGQGHQTWYELLGPKQGYNNAKFERPAVSSVCQKANVKSFVKSENTSVISHAYIQSEK